MAFACSSKEVSRFFIHTGRASIVHMGVMMTPLYRCR